MPPISTACSTPSTRPSPMAWAWGSPSAARSSRPMADDWWLGRTRHMALSFASLCQLAAGRCPPRAAAQSNGAQRSRDSRRGAVQSSDSGRSDRVQIPGVKGTGSGLAVGAAVARGSAVRRPRPMLEGVHLLLIRDDCVTLDRFEDEGRCELLLRGELRLDDAREVFERAQAEDCSRVVLDFSGCEVEDRALSALADLLNEARVRIAVRGLRERQL